MEAQPAAVGAGDLLCLAKKADEEKQHHIRVDLRLEFEVARVVLGLDGADAALELERGMKGVVDFLDKGDELADVGIVQAAPGVVPLELLDEPLRIVDADAEMVPRATQERACQFAKLPRGSSGEPAQLMAP